MLTDKSRFGASKVISITSIKEFFSSTRWAILCILAAGLVGCQREEIRIYTAPSEAGAALPLGWRESKPGPMSLASYKISDEKGRQAEASVARLADLSGKDALIVNMWRGQVGLSELSEEEAAKQFSPVMIAGEQGKLFEVTGKNDEGAFHIVTALRHSPEGTWFYRMSGDAGLVADQKTAFVNFLRTIKIDAHDHPPGAHPEEAHETTSSPQFKWEVPGNWKSETPGKMQDALFSVEKAAVGKAQVSVSVFPHDTGGTLLNVNRWRKQIELAPTDESQLTKLVSPLDQTNPQTILVDMSNDEKKQRIVAAVVPRGGKYWFYKLLGDAEVVGSEKDSFIAFAKSQP